MDKDSIKYNWLLHLYTFGPKYGKEGKEEAYNEVRKSVYESYYGHTQPEELGDLEYEIVKIREVRDISLAYLQYCVDVRLRPGPVGPEKRRKV